MDKQQLEKDLKLKNDELATLQANVLSDIQKKQKEQLEKDRDDLQKQLDDLKKIENDTTNKQTNKEQQKLKENINTTDKTILKYIEWSVMETKLKTLETSWEIKNFTIEKFATEISTTVETYLKQSFKKSGTEVLNVSDGVISSLSIGTQFSMMDELTRSWAQGVDFFSNFSKTDTKDASSTLTGLVGAFGSGWMIDKLFGGVGKTNGFFTLAKKVENCVGFISRYSGEWKELGDGSQVQKLSNPNDFRKLLTDVAWTDDTLLLSKTPKDLWLIVSNEKIGDMSEQDKIDLKKIVDNDKMPINKKSIEVIMASLPIAQNFLEKRSWYKNQAVDLMATVWWFLDINVFGFWSLWSIIWIQNPMELFRGKDGKKKWWVLNFALKIMWFNNWIEWLYQEYLRQNIDKNMTPEGKEFIKNSLQTYKNLITTWWYTGAKTIDVFALTGLAPALQAKIPSDLDTIKKSLYDNINDKKASLNIWVLQSLWVIVPTKEDADKNIIIDKDRLNELIITEDTMTKYLQITIPSLVNNVDFMTGIKTSDDFMLALTGGLVCGTFFAWWVALGIENLSIYQDSTLKTPDNQNYETLWYTPKTLSTTWLDLEKCKLSNDEYKKFTEKVIKISSNLWIDPEHLMKVMTFESAGTLNTKIQNPLSSATWLIQFMDSTAVNLGTTTNQLKNMYSLQQLDFVEQYFLPYKDKLHTLEDVYLAVFSPAFIGKPLSYVGYYKWSAAYTQNIWFDTNKDGKMTVEEITATVRDTTKNLSFFDVSVTNPEQYAWNPDILAKNFDQLALVGDSHAGGIKSMWWLSIEQTKNFHYFNGNDTAQLLAKIKEQKTTLINGWIQSLILITWANDITKNLVGNMKNNLQAIKDEIAPVQLVLPTLQYYADKNMVPDTKVDQVNAIIKNFAQENWLPIIDINKNVILAASDYQIDKRHLTASGYTKVVHEITHEVMWDNLA